MDFDALKDSVEKAVPDAVVRADAETRDPHLVVAAEKLPEVCRFLESDGETAFDQLSLVSGVDYPGRGEIEVVYHLDSLKKKHTLVLKVVVPRDEPKVPTLCGVWRTADWHERETFDLVGVVFEGHPNLTRILCCEDWVGHPLRKDYQWPEEYHGIPAGPFAGEGSNRPPEWESEGFE